MTVERRLHEAEQDIDKLFEKVSEVPVVAEQLIGLRREVELMREENRQQHSDGKQAIKSMEQKMDELSKEIKSDRERNDGRFTKIHFVMITGLLSFTGVLAAALFSTLSKLGGAE